MGLSISTRSGFPFEKDKPCSNTRPAANRPRGVALPSCLLCLSQADRLDILLHTVKRPELEEHFVVVACQKLLHGDVPCRDELVGLYLHLGERGGIKVAIVAQVKVAGDWDARNPNWVPSVVKNFSLLSMNTFTARCSRP